MKNGRFQCKDIDDAFFLRCVDYGQTYHAPGRYRAQPALLKREGDDARWPVWVFIWDLEFLMPLFPTEVIRAKAATLISRGLLEGCSCGCRGDFELTIEGAQFLRKAGHEVTQDPGLYMSAGCLKSKRGPLGINAAGGSA